MRAEITYNGGRSCQVYGVTFKEGLMKLSSDPKLIQRCQETAGFAVHILKEKKTVASVETEEKPPEKKPQKVIVPVAMKPAKKTKPS